MEIKNTKHQYLLAIITGLVGFCYGLVIGWLPPYLSLLSSENTPLDNPLTMDEITWIVSFSYLGNFVGTLIFGYLVDLIGRKWSILATIIPILVSTLLTLFGRNATDLYVLELMMGIGGGGMIAVVPVFITEIADVGIRGKLSSVAVVNMHTAIMTGIIIGSFVTYYETSYILISFTVVTLFLNVFLIVESPVYLLQKGKQQEATKILIWLRGKPCDGEERSVEDLQKTILENKNSSIENKIQYKELLMQPTLKGIFIGVMMFVIQQSSGYFPVLTYSGIIFEESGSIIAPKISTIIVSVLKTVATILSNILVERSGRKILLMISSVGVTACLLIMGTFLYLKHIEIDVSPYNWIPLITLSIFSFIFSVGLGVIPYVLASELFSHRIKSAAVSICVFSYGLIAFILSVTFSVLVSALEFYGCFWTFGVLSLFGAIFIWVYVPETKGRTTEEILNDLLEKKT